VPDDIGVVTFDNYPLAEYMEPPLTVVDVDTYKLGEAAAIALFEEIKQVTKKEENISIPTQIIARESTKKGRGM
jgi:DNA-binding LacI/PurR family transcriptional regulator